MGYKLLFLFYLLLQDLMVIKDGLNILLPKVAVLSLIFVLSYCYSMFYNRP